MVSILDDMLSSYVHTSKNNEQQVWTGEKSPVLIMSHCSVIHFLYVCENVSGDCVSERILCYILCRHTAFLYCDSVGEMQDVHFLKKLYYIYYMCMVSHLCGYDNVI